jgi:two-component system NtrC family sensor kinase
MGDRYHLEQAFLNLALNALAAMSPGGGTLTFRTRFGSDNTGRRRVVVSVSDTGSGIKGADIARIFDPFYTTKDPGKGTGLGLAIVKEIIDAHSGEIRVESVPGVGSTFSVFLSTADASTVETSREKAASQ